MTDIEIANSVSIKPIMEISSKINCNDYLEPYGLYKGKIDSSKVTSSRKGKLVLVTAISPTPFGEGKTTVSIGLLDAMCLLGKDAIGVLREPSLGPVFGIKGGATGGGYSQVIPMEDINLNFTGDIHAIELANNLLCAAIDNHIKQGNELKIDINNIKFQRCMDMNDRALKKISVSLGDNARIDGFNITAASEVMAIFCLAKDLFDLKVKLGNILIATDMDGKPLYAKDLNVHGAMSVLLKDAIKPNLVQTLEGNPVILHGGPFANIAHGCNSIIATELGLKLRDIVITEAGFGSDLGALKFLDIKCRLNDIYPDCVVLVATIKALKYNGNGSICDGVDNLNAHLDILKNYTNNIVVAINKYEDDIDDDINYLVKYCSDNEIDVELSEAYKLGGNGATKLASKVLDVVDNNNDKVQIYSVNDKLESKISKILSDLYGAGEVEYSDKSLKEIEFLEKYGLDKKPICVAKTQYSLSPNKELLGRPKGYKAVVTDIGISNGAGFIKVYLGNIMTMPGLPKKPNYEKIDIDEDGNIIGIF